MKTALLLVFLVICTFSSVAQDVKAVAYSYLETSATADSLVIPDIIHLEIEINEKSDKEKLPLEEREQKVLDKLRSIGIDVDKQISVTDLASNFRRYFIKKDEILLKKSFKLKVFDVKTAANVFKAMDEIYVPEVALTKIEYSKANELKLELRTKAVLRAKLQAEALLKPLNQKVLAAVIIEDLIRFEANRYGDHLALEEVVVNPKLNIRRSMDEVKYYNLQFEPIRLTSTVKVRFRIE